MDNLPRCVRGRKWTEHETVDTGREACDRGQGDRSPLHGTLLQAQRGRNLSLPAVRRAVVPFVGQVRRGMRLAEFRRRNSRGREAERGCRRTADGDYLRPVRRPSGAGEGFTPKNTRHCVNSVSLAFQPAKKEQTETAIFAGGCFWGVEHLLSKEPGVLDVESGYIGGHTENPTYEQVCSHRTGHAEAVRVTFDPAKVSYERLARLFFEIHDPTQVDRQGPDIGDQYRSEVFYTTPAQRETAEKLIAELRAKGYDVVTNVTQATTFWPAEGYHQDYYDRKGTQPYCHAYTKRF